MNSMSWNVAYTIIAYLPRLKSNKFNMDETFVDIPVLAAKFFAKNLEIAIDIHSQICYIMYRLSLEL